MQKLSIKMKQKITSGFFGNYMWNTAIMTGLLGQNITGALGLVAQLVHVFNPAPRFTRHQFIDNPAARMYTRIAQHPSRATLSFGSPFF
ncbi:hypothetical protein OF376_00205 [Ureaplasma miroungigenitalium]|uniref:Uncharacterized protein n=2 Tax=Ureaplasma miroungigenitalium TaxID=1042321 RepID=A0ABT3BM36_9BACT|nr:hypothetical protein [Ureaplasma miroungigenitalium]MCV3728212.1 hypothetical protein [Ureaplasma miroungigenitalium]